MHRFMLIAVAAFLVLPAGSASSAPAAPGLQSAAIAITDFSSAAKKKRVVAKPPRKVEYLRAAGSPPPTPTPAR